MFTCASLRKVSDHYLHINSNVLEENYMIHSLDIRLASLSFGKPLV